MAGPGDLASTAEALAALQMSVSPQSAKFRCSRGFIVHSVQSGPSRDLPGTITPSTAAVAADGRARLDEAHELCRRR